MTSQRAFVALGSNLGSSAAIVEEAARALAARFPGAVASSLYRTEPQGCPPGSPPFVNAVVAIDVTVSPEGLLGVLRELERAQGRPDARVKNAPRTLDLDIVAVGSCILHTKDLTIPHPRALSRAFVLAPLAEVAPSLVLPGAPGDVASALAALPDEARAEVTRLRPIVL